MRVESRVGNGGPLGGSQIHLHAAPAAGWTLGANAVSTTLTPKLDSGGAEPKGEVGPDATSAVCIAGGAVDECAKRLSAVGVGWGRGACGAQPSSFKTPPVKRLRLFTRIGAPYRACGAGAPQGKAS